MMTEERFESIRQDCGRVTLRHGRWYALTLRDGTVVPMQAMNWDPTCRPWQLVEDYDTCPEGDVPAHLSVRPDGRFERDSGYVPSDTDRDVRAIEEGLTVFDLVPADDLARSAWARTAGRYATCPRCGGSDEAYHHPLCHTADGVPLFPAYDADAWRSEVAECPVLGGAEVPLDLA